MSTAEQIIADVVHEHTPMQDNGPFGDDPWTGCAGKDCADWPGGDDEAFDPHVAAHVVAALTNAGYALVKLPEPNGTVRRTWPSLGAVPHDVKVEDSDGDEFEYYPCDNGWRYTLPDGDLSELFDGSDELGTLTEVVVPMLGEWAAARVAEGGER